MKTKNTLLTFLGLLFFATAFAQNFPQGINYQAVARDINGDVLIDHPLGIKLSIISDISTGIISWQETHLDTTNTYGLFTTIIGTGTTTGLGASATFNEVDWGASNHFLKIEIDYDSSGYVDMGTTGLMSVPYSMNAKVAANVNPIDELQNLSISGDTLFISNGNYVILDFPVINQIECFIAGCTDTIACNYNPSACYNNGSCLTAYGCTDTTACNYNPLATCNDGSLCTFPDGCTDIAACNYNLNATCDDGSCVYPGCTDSTACNYDPTACNDDGSCFSPCPNIGDSFQGGIVAYIDSSGYHGIIVAASNQGSGYNNSWGCYGTNIPGADGIVIGTGNQNTINIMSACSSLGIAARICGDLVLNGYGDWFLPSLNELIIVNTNVGIGNGTGGSNIANFTYNSYWTSSEVDANNAYIYSVNFFNALPKNKTWGYYVRAVRYF